MVCVAGPTHEIFLLVVIPFLSLIGLYAFAATITAMTRST